MGWLVLALAGLCAAAGLWALGLSRRLWSLAGAVLMLGATGYALQGRPALPAKPVVADAAPIEIDPGLVGFRAAILAASREDEFAFATADNRLREGDAHAAAAGLAAEVARRPGDAALWSQFGYVLALHDGSVSPSARFAFQRALALAPRQPGPPFFLGMAYANAGEFAAARPAWIEALRLTPKTAPYRGDIAARIAAVDQFQRMAEAERAAGVR